MLGRPMGLRALFGNFFKSPDVAFVREERKPTKLGTGTATYRIYRSRSMASAYSFLENNVVDRDC